MWVKLVAPLKIETGRYEVNRVPVEERLCEACNSVEEEFDVLMKCPLYRDAKDICFNSISAVLEVFADLPQESQFIELMSNPLHYKIISKFMYHVPCITCVYTITLCFLSVFL